MNSAAATAAPARPIWTLTLLAAPMAIEVVVLPAAAVVEGEEPTVVAGWVMTVILVTLVAPAPALAECVSVGLTKVALGEWEWKPDDAVNRDV